MGGGSSPPLAWLHGVLCSYTSKMHHAIYAFPLTYTSPTNKNVLPMLSSAKWSAQINEDVGWYLKSTRVCFTTLTHSACLAGSLSGFGKLNTPIPSLPRLLLQPQTEEHLPHCVLRSFVYNFPYLVDNSVSFHEYQRKIDTIATRVNNIKPLPKAQ